MKNVIFITSRLDLEHGGLTSSLLNKSRILYDEKGLKSTILTFHAATNFEYVKSTIIQRYDLKDKVEIYNINEYFRSQNLKYEPKKYNINTQSYTPVKINENKFEYYKEGIKVIEIYYDKNKIKEVRHFGENSICTSKDIIDSDGYIYWRSFYSNRNLARQVFYRKDQTPFLTREFDFINASDKIISLVLFDGEPLRFNTFNEFKEYFIKKYIKKPITYLVGEARALDPVIMNIDNIYVRKVFMTHSIHIRPGTDIIRAGNRVVLNNLNNIDALVVLTEKQKEDIKNRFGERNNYYVIPHSIQVPEIKNVKVNNNVVIISRLHPEKRLDHSIRAFEKVVKKIPNATLSIYGEGQERENLQKLINKLGLQNQIKLMGYTKEINKVLQSADCSLLTSQYEGFALAIQESIANGTPVIAYDINYGPSSMIDNGKNGYLIKDGEVNELSNHIIKYLNKSKEEKKNFFENAIEKARKFSNQNFANSWFNLLEDLNTRTNNMCPTVSLIHLKRQKFNKLKYKIYLEVKLNCKEKIAPVFKGCFLRKTSDNNCEKEIVSAKVISHNKNTFVLEIVFDAKKYEKGNSYDLSLLISHKDKFFDIPTEYKLKKINLTSLSHKKCKIYLVGKNNFIRFQL
ncbi:TPA: glycosyltransferase [Staphylococcus aureus]|nr:glycosyltransferase [Staphylococcus aureus]HCX2173555.1 glycosyltransferase [Staphylococcus aureus]HCX2269137.1 glycosyltransferase [Staphylococcus aureus]HCX2269415.1 glycosyltransferase [Staphylococcus aureus]HCX2359170.1 glycosyltransferase [Staphylococcus aureus]